MVTWRAFARASSVLSLPPRIPIQFRPLRLRAETVEEAAAHAVPLRVVQDGAHVDQHRQLALEEAAARVRELLGIAADGRAIELLLIELAAQVDVLLLHFAAQIDQIARRGAEDRLQLVLLFLGEIQGLDDLRTPPPLALRKVPLRKRRGG